MFAGLKAGLIQRLIDFEPTIWDNLDNTNNREDELVNQVSNEINPNPSVSGEPLNRD